MNLPPLKSWRVWLFRRGERHRENGRLEAIAKDADVYTAASGKVQDEPASAGTYYLVGRAATACTGDGDTFEVIPCLPQLTKVIANGSTLGQTQAAMVNGAVVIVLGA